MNSKEAIVLGFLSVGAILCIVLPITLVYQTNSPKLVHVVVNEGNLVGITTKESAAFLGVPFSQPPINDLRWKRPLNPRPYSSNYWDASYLRPGCDQICNQPASDYSCPEKTSEDCLYLNIWVPRKYLKLIESNDVVNETHYKIDEDRFSDEISKLPVLVWFYGGNFRNGAGSCTIYDGRFMADKGDVVVVTTNYRVSQLGFLAFGTDGEESVGNFGIYDQIKTLEWIKNNIHAFGGDAGKVTIFGQSAGAESIAIHLTSTKSDEYFHKAILQSNPFGLPFRTLDDSRKLGDIFASELNCTSMSCMRKKSLMELEAAYNSTLLKITDANKLMLLFQPWGPIIDNVLLFDQPINLFRQKRQQPKPVIMGSTIDEGMIFLAEAFPEPMNEKTYRALVNAVFKREQASKVLTEFPPCGTPNCDNRIVLSPAVTRYVFFCPQRLALFNGTTSQQWLYVFNQTWSFKELWEEEMCYDRVCHAAEIAYLFGVESLTEFQFTYNEEQLSSRLIKYWSNFAKYSNPNGNPSEQISVSSEWPNFKFSEKAHDYTAKQLNGDGDFLMQNPFSEECMFWDELDAYTEHYFYFH